MAELQKSNSAHITTATNLTTSIQAWEIYLDDQGRSPHTIKAFTGDLRLFASYLAPDRNLGSITTADINHFLDWLQKGRGEPCSPKTLSRRITSIKSFFKWLHGAGVILSNPALKVVQHSVISPLPKVLTIEDESRVVEAANTWRLPPKPDARPYVLLTLLLTTGIKKGECLEIDLNHIDLESPSGPVLFIRYANPSYRYKERKIALSNEWVEGYQEYLAQYQPQEKLFPWSQRRLEYILEDIGKRAGLKKHLSFDMCRWTSALRDWQNEEEKEKIRIKLGVTKIQWRELSMKLRRLAANQEKMAEPANKSAPDNV
ncbi:MAG: site-specific integrase [Anaerolineaceae bacterium]|nr:site-specific integrase [Anaerolineaceae bacterium]